MKADPYTLHVALDATGTAAGQLYMDDGDTEAYEQGAFLKVPLPSKLPFVDPPPRLLASPLPHLPMAFLAQSPRGRSFGELDVGLLGVIVLTL